MTDLSPSAAKVQAVLEAAGIAAQVVELPASTRSAVEAAAAVGCTVGQIVKSLVFTGSASGRPLLVLASGRHRVDESRLAALAREPVTRATPDYVRAHTGFAIGGVPPVGHATPMRTLLDRTLFEHGELWAAAGTPHAVFRVSPADLARVTQAEVADIAVVAQGA